MKPYWYAAFGLMACGVAQAATVDVDMNLVTGQGIGQEIGKVTISETPYGLLFTPQLKALPAGVHGFHVHENGSCEPGMKEGKAVAALAAGGILIRKKPASTLALTQTATWRSAGHLCHGRRHGQRSGAGTAAEKNQRNNRQSAHGTCRWRQPFRPSETLGWRGRAFRLRCD